MISPSVLLVTLVSSCKEAIHFFGVLNVKWKEVMDDMEGRCILLVRPTSLTYTKTWWSIMKI